jgi:PTH1 family peptidyl-tRNA hydrolase
MRVVCGLGNPGPEYEHTRHNVAWWLLEHAREQWSFPKFRRQGISRVSEGFLHGEQVLLLAPWTYVNRSGRALLPLLKNEDFDPKQDLLVVVDDVAIDVGRVRLRASGSSGGHNGLKSVEGALRTQEYPRLRIGVGGAPPGVDLADWVLSPMPEEERRAIDSMMPDLVTALATWAGNGVEAAARLHNR